MSDSDNGIPRREAFLSVALGAGAVVMGSLAASGATAAGLASSIAAADALSTVRAPGEPKATGSKTSVGAQDIADILIIGAGTAGIPAAIQAADLGAKVILIDKNPGIGGELHGSGGTMSAAQTILQLSRGVVDSPDLHYADAMKLGDYGQDPEILRLHVNNAPALVDWLTSLGLEFTPESPELLQMYPWSAPRTYWPVDNARGVLRVLNRELQKRVKRGDVTIHVDTNAKKLIKDESGRIVGVIAEDDSKAQREYRAKAVIIATGGYARNKEMIAKYNPNSVNAICQAMPHVTGDGILMAQQAGAQLRNMDKFITAPGMVAGPKTGADESGRRSGVTVTWPPNHDSAAILVNKLGQRFMSEDDPRFKERLSEFGKQPDATAFLIFDETIRQEMPPMVAAMGFEPGKDAEGLEREIASGGSVQTASTIAALANKIGIDAASLRQTVDTYNGFVAAGVDQRFQRKHLIKLDREPFYALRITGSFLTTPGGVKINHSLQAVDENDKVIPGLYVAGEAIGTAVTMGDSLVSGMSFTPALCLGRLAGRFAYHYAMTVS